MAVLKKVNGKTRIKNKGPNTTNDEPNHADSKVPVGKKKAQNRAARKARKKTQRAQK